MIISFLWVFKVVALAAFAGGIGAGFAGWWQIWLRRESAALIASSKAPCSERVWRRIKKLDEQVIARLFLTISLPLTVTLVSLFSGWRNYSINAAIEWDLAVFAVCALALFWAVLQRGRFLKNLHESPGLGLPPVAVKGFTEAEFELLNPRPFRNAGSSSEP